MYGREIGSLSPNNRISQRDSLRCKTFFPHSKKKSLTTWLHIYIQYTYTHILMYTQNPHIYILIQCMDRNVSIWLACWLAECCK